MIDASEYGSLFRDAYSLLHGGRPGDSAIPDGRRSGESLEEYLSRSRAEAVGRMRKRLLAAEPPAGAAEAHRLLLDLLENAAQADQALAEQVRAYQCGQFHESVTHSDRLHALVEESARLDRALVTALRGLSPAARAEIGVELEAES